MGISMRNFKIIDLCIRNAPVERCYETCKDCRYTCSKDYVAGFWSGVKAALKSIEEYKRNHCA